MGLVTTLLLVGTLGGCLRVGFSDNRRDDAGRDTDTRHDQPDVGDEGPDIGDQRPDLPRDLGPRPQITCAPPTLITASEVQLEGPAISDDGLSLIVLEHTTPRRALLLTRATATSAFGAPKATNLLPQAAEDIDLVTLADKSAALAAFVVSSTRRALVLCSRLPAQSSGCEALELRRHDGSLVTDDTDGPSLVKLVSGWRLVFNIATPTDDADVYLGIPLDASLRSWSVEPIAAINTPAMSDDPVIHPDGRLIIYELSSKANAPTRLHAVTRQNPEVDFGPPFELDTGNATSRDAGPEIFPLDANRFEFFFVSTRETTSLWPQRLYHSICNYL